MSVQSNSAQERTNEGKNEHKNENERTNEQKHIHTRNKQTNEQTNKRTKTKSKSKIGSAELLPTNFLGNSFLIFCFDFRIKKQWLKMTKICIAHYFGKKSFPPLWLINVDWISKTFETSLNWDKWTLWQPKSNLEFFQKRSQYRTTRCWQTEIHRQHLGKKERKKVRK